MAPYLGAVLALFLGTPSASIMVTGSGRTICYQQHGLALGWAQPFSICGVLNGIIEGVGNPINYFPMTPFIGCMSGCVSLNRTDWRLSFYWCSSLTPKPVFLLPQKLPHLDIAARRRNHWYQFIGCTENYRTIFDLTVGLDCDNELCELFTLYEGKRNELPPAYRFEDGYTMDEPDQGRRHGKPPGAIYGESVAPTLRLSRWYILLFATSIHCGVLFWCSAP